MNQFAKRCLSAVPVFFGITLLVFFMMNMAPATIADAAGEGEASSAARAALEAELGFDQPIPLRYLHWLQDLLRGDLGTSYRTGQSVGRMIAQRMGPSLLLTGTGILWAVLLGVPLGVLAAWKPHSGWSRLAGGLALFSFSAPGFFLSLLGICLFSVKLGWLPAAGMYSAGTSGPLPDLLRHLLLPGAVVCLGSIGNLIRQAQSAVGEVLGEDYIRTARAKGAGEGRVTLHHALKNALIPVVTVIGLHFGTSLGGAVIAETVFALPGLGKLMITGINQKDEPIVMGCLITFACIFSLINLLVDILYAYIDPRIKSQYR